MATENGVDNRILNAQVTTTQGWWWQDRGLLRLNILLGGVMLGSMEFGYDQALISGLQANTLWYSDLGINSASMEGLVIASLAFGSLAALLPGAYLCDYLGRRWTIILANFGIIGGAVGQTFTQTAVQFLGTRLVLGFTGVVIAVASPTLLAELSHPSQRAVVTAMYMTFFYAGATTSAWANYGTLNVSGSWSWRLPIIIQVFWACAQTALMWFCPESPRWLVYKNRPDEAKQILTRYHANGREGDELVELEFQEIVSSVQADRAIEVEGPLLSWALLIKTRGNVRRTVLVIFLGLCNQWVGNGIVSYYLVPILKSVGINSSADQQGINGGLQIFNWAMAFVGASLAEKAGRKFLLLLSSVGMFFSMALVTTCSALFSEKGYTGAGYATIVFLFVFFGFYDVGFTPIMPLYVTELSPTNLRAKYQSLYWISTSAALCFNQYINPIAMSAIAWRYYFVYLGVLIFVSAILFFFVPETKGLTLEEVAALFDGGSDRPREAMSEKDDTRATVETLESV